MPVSASRSSRAQALLLVIFFALSGTEESVWLAQREPSSATVSAQMLTRFARPLTPIVEPVLPATRVTFWVLELASVLPMLLMPDPATPSAPSGMETFALNALSAASGEMEFAPPLIPLVKLSTPAMEPAHHVIRATSPGTVNVSATPAAPLTFFAPSGTAISASSALSLPSGATESAFNQTLFARPSTAITAGAHPVTVDTSLTTVSAFALLTSQALVLRTSFAPSGTATSASNAQREPTGAMEFVPKQTPSARPSILTMAGASPATADTTSPAESASAQSTLQITLLQETSYAPSGLMESARGALSPLTGRTASALRLTPCARPSTATTVLAPLVTRAMLCSTASVSELPILLLMPSAPSGTTESAFSAPRQPTSATVPASSPIRSAAPSTQATVGAQPATTAMYSAAATVWSHQLLRNRPPTLTSTARPTSPESARTASSASS